MGGLGLLEIGLVSNLSTFGPAPKYEGSHNAYYVKCSIIPLSSSPRFRVHLDRYLDNGRYRRGRFELQHLQSIDRILCTGLSNIPLSAHR